MSDFNDIKKELRAFSYFLVNWKSNVKNADLLNRLDISNSQRKIDYSLQRSEHLIFQNLDIERHVIPQGIDKLCPDTERDFEVELTINLVQIDKYVEKNDPIISLGLSIKIEGEYEKEGEDIQNAICSWHLDKGVAEGAKYNHPVYHMNFGGDLMSDKIIEEENPNYFGKLLLLPSPRIMHPPMDIILACDFIIKNFYETDNHRELTTQPGYLELIRKAKNRYVKPYAYALVSNWESAFEVEKLNHSSIFGY